MDVSWNNGGFCYPPNHPFVHRVFHDFHHPFWGFPPYGAEGVRRFDWGFDQQVLLSLPWPALAFFLYSDVFPSPKKGHFTTCWMYDVPFFWFHYLYIAKYGSCSTLMACEIEIPLLRLRDEDGKKCVHIDTFHKSTILTSIHSTWWFQPIWNICRMGSIPHGSGWNFV